MEPSPLSIAVAVLGAVSFCGLFPLGAVAVVLATLELSRVRSGRSSPRSEDWATGGRVLGVISVLLGLMVAFWWKAG